MPAHQTAGAAAYPHRMVKPAGRLLPLMIKPSLAISTAILIAALGSALAIAGLEHPQFAALDGELDILHVLVMLFQLGGDVHELVVDFGHLGTEMLDRVGIADTGHHIFTLGIQQVLAHHFLFTSGGVAGKGHARAGVIAHVAKDHRHNVDCGAQVIGDVGGLAVIDGFLAHSRIRTRPWWPVPAV